MDVKITKVINHGEFLQTFAKVTEEGVTKHVSFCHDSLPFTEDGVYSALAAKFYEPEVEKKPEAVSGSEPLEVEPLEVSEREPDLERIASVKALEDTWKAIWREEAHYL